MSASPSVVWFRKNLRLEDNPSIVAALDWSYELLDDRQRHILRQLAVFPTGIIPTDGAAVGASDGTALGLSDGATLGAADGARLGAAVRTRLEEAALNRLVARGEVDASAIDSQVLALELRDALGVEARRRGPHDRRHLRDREQAP